MEPEQNQTPDYASLSAEEIGKLGLELYNKHLKVILENDYHDKWVAIHLETVDYFTGGSATDAAKKGRKKYPNGVFFIMRIAAEDED